MAKAKHIGGMCAVIVLITGGMLVVARRQASPETGAVVVASVVAEPPASTCRGTAAYEVDFGHPVTEADLLAIETRGGRVVDWLSDSTALVELTAEGLASVTNAPASGSSPVPSVKVLSAAGKLQDGLDLTSGALQPLTILPLSVEDLAAIERRVVELGGTVLGRAGLKDGVPRLRVMLAGTSVAELAERAEVSWVERFTRPRLLNDVAVGPALMNITPVREELGLTGRGQVITTSDSGVDTGDLATIHEDLRTNLIGFAKATEGEFENTDDDGNVYMTRIAAADFVGHGTHTAGSIVGTGAKSDGRFKGAAPEAKLWAWFCSDADGAMYTPPEMEDLFRPSALGETNAYIHSASWGGERNVYSAESKAIDTWCWNHPDLLPVFSAGNSGNDRTVSAEGGAKNVLCVGATENDRPKKGGYSDNPDDLAYFSSRGPMPDGRIKPDVCAPGTYVISTRSSQAAGTGWGVYNSDYLYNCGTSMATPLTAGSVALVRQWLVEEAGFTNRAPSAALMKAMVTGGATRLGDGMPNNRFGWGRVNIAETVMPTNGLGVAVRDYIPFGRGSSETFVVTTTNAAPLDVQLCWIDYPASTRSVEQKSLVVDLDLEVVNLATGEAFSPGDHVNNLESVHLDRTEPGAYAITVKGYSTRYDSTQGGAAALYVRGAFENLSEMEPEYVTLTVAAEGGGDGNCSPAVGAHRYIKGETVTLTAGKYDDENGEDYRHSSYWGLDVECYPFICWQGEGTPVPGGFEPEVTLTLTNDVTITWWWRDRPSEVALWLETYNDFYDLLMYPNYPTGLGVGYWIPCGKPQILTAADSPMLDAYASADAGMTVPVSGVMYINYRGRPYRYSFGTLRFTSFRVLDEEENATYGWDAANRYRLADGVTLPMTSFTAVQFGYADETDRNETVGLPYWWWARNFWGAWQNGAVAVEDTYATGDPDGDGFVNLAEYEEPTDPWKADEFPFRFTDVTPTNLTFIGSTSGTLSLQHTGHLGDIWTNLWTDATARPSVTNQIVHPLGNPPAGFYRLHHER